MKNLTAESAEVPVSASVDRATEAMVRAVHLHDESKGRSEEVGDGVTEDDLATEGNAELRAGESGLEHAFGFRGEATVLGGTRREQVTASW